MTTREQRECLPHAALDKQVNIHNNRKKQVKGCIADAYPLQLNLVGVLFDPAIPTSSFNFIVHKHVVMLLLAWKSQEA